MSPWQEFVAAHTEGGVLDGVVSRALPFGAFVEVAPGVHGLLVTERVPAPGSRVTVRIEAIDVERRRFSLVQA